ncbi:MAG: hypothetical protein HZB61_13620 [Nitrospirae bacterium]|nr:hypothetical protein [Nitrospirota bacterium]
MRRIYFFLILAVLISFGCSKEVKKPSEDSQLASEAVNKIEAIKTAYQEKDAAILQQQLDAGLSEDILRELSFEKAELSFTPRFVSIKSDSVIINLSWQGSWLIKEKKLENRGTANLVLHRDTMKLTQIEGDNPFHLP